MTDAVEPENKEIPAHRVTSRELTALLGETRANCLLRHEWYSKYVDYEKAYRYGRSKTGFIKVDVFPFFREVHKTAEGGIRPETYMSFSFSRSGYRVIQAHQFVRSKVADDI